MCVCVCACVRACMCEFQDDCCMNNGLLKVVGKAHMLKSNCMIFGTVVGSGV